MIGDDCMEKKTIFIHKEKHEINNDTTTEYRLVTFVNGNGDIMKIIKELIKNKHQS